VRRLSSGLRVTRVQRTRRKHGIAGLFVLGLATVSLIAACSGGQAGTDSVKPKGQITVQELDSFAACVRGHGVVNFYFTAQTRDPSTPPSDSQIAIGGYSAVADPSSPQFEHALRACRHLLPLPPPPSAAQLRHMLNQGVRFAACMRSHGFSGYPDPTVQDGFLSRPALPTGIDQNSPQFQAAAKACNSAPS
jgi:hypothetical protein